MEVKIQIPDNCELIKNGDTYIVKEKKNDKPRTWEEFCEMNPIKVGEAFIDCTDDCNPITEASFCIGKERKDKCWCTSKQEAKAFLALMQLRQLRKAWIGDWEPIKGETYWGIFNNIAVGICTNLFAMSNTAMSFPTKEMAEDFLNCFKDLCETAKILL